MPLELSAFRAVMGSFPTGVVIVTTVDAEGLPRGLTTQSFVSVSSDPPLLLICIDKTSRTLPALQATRAFVVNVLAAGREELSGRFASKAEDKFAGLEWRPAASAAGAPVLVRDSVAYAECVVTAAIEAGDHWVLLASVEDGALLGGTPLLYYRRSYAAWPERVDGGRPLAD